ncbi:helix-hairpin-helix domain-containing protein [Pontiella sp.]|uniref:helix-hairpin-helix domain-containing protein n=1 Tax=Pontiella sp. TaxID=2837462 RepID=UPI003564211E
MTKRRSTVLLLTLFAIVCRGDDLVRLDGAKLADYGGNDGDSFMIEHKGKKQVVRLYYVDCPETHASTETDARRARDQANYFGLSDSKQVFFYGKAATAFTRQQLAKPFTVHTAYADALGRSPGGRVFAFVTTADGKDLARLLVENGLARSYGYRRQLPDGTHYKEAQARLDDMETAAALKKIGIWERTNPDRLVELRASTRLEEAELHAIAEGNLQENRKININSAPAEELETIHGIGPATAKRIIELRPFKNADDLDRIPRLPAKTKANLIERATF